MSTTYPEPTTVSPPQPAPAPSVAHPQPAPATPEATTEVRRPLVWLLAIVGIALAVRLWHVNADFQLDEFSSLYPVAERHVSSPGALPSSADPLGPVASWQEVRDRSVLPYGIVNPVPLYHYVLYGLVQVLPVAEWSLRAPSIVAGLACVLGIYLLCRRLFGAEVALVAALFAAVDPLQIGSSVLARPYALGNLVCLLSFFALLKLLDARNTAQAVLAMAGYGLTLALIGYLSPLLLIVVVAHLGMVIYWARAGGFRQSGDADHRPGLEPNAVRRKALLWLAGCGLAVVLLAPVLGYWVAVARFSAANHETILALMPPQLVTFVKHNSTFLLALLVISVTEYVVASRLPLGDTNGAGNEETAPTANGTAPTNGEAPAAAAPAPVPPPPPLPENPDLLWLGRLWFFLPQAVLVLLAFGGLGQTVFSSNYVCYTSLGGVILLACWATRNGAREVRLGVAAAVALAMLFWGYTDWSKGGGLTSAATSRTFVAVLDQLSAEGRWKEKDALLVRPAVLEAFLLPDRIPQATRDRVEGAILSPYTTLYVNETPKPVFCLGLSLFKGERFAERAGPYFQPEDPEEAALAARLQPYTGFFINSADPGRQAFMARLVPWLANARGADLKVARKRSAEEERYFTVKKQSQLGETIEGLSDSQASDFSFLVRVSVLPPEAKK
jgi:hypothetical protein